MRQRAGSPAPAGARRDPEAVAAGTAHPRTDADRTDADRTDADRTDADRTDADRTDAGAIGRLLVAWVRL